MAKGFIRTDCFAYLNNSETKGCKGLKVLQCKAGVCPFFKTREQVDAENARVVELGFKSSKNEGRGLRFNG